MKSKFQIQGTTTQIQMKDWRIYLLKAVLVYVIESFHLFSQVVLTHVNLTPVVLLHAQ